MKMRKVSFIFLRDKSSFLKTKSAWPYSPPVDDGKQEKEQNNPHP